MMDGSIKLLTNGLHSILWNSSHQAVATVQSQMGILILLKFSDYEITNAAIVLC